MNSDQTYSQFALCREMTETPDILRKFQLGDAGPFVEAIRSAKKLFFTGEGSSRIFPAKNCIANGLRAGVDIAFATDGGRQADEYDLSAFAVFAASNSGRTKEVIALFDKLAKSGHDKLFGLTANKDTRLESLAKKTFVLSCGGEDAVAATKSVAEQALFYQLLIGELSSCKCWGCGSLDDLGDAFEAALQMPIDPGITKAIANAGTIYFAGRNDGVAEELTLKTNEITRKKSDYLEGTYAVHGIEEVMNADDVVIWIDPFPAEFDKIKETLIDGVGLKVIAIAADDTPFETLKIADVGKFNPYVQLAAGWNILVEVGIALSINLDKPTRARKVGNEFVG